MAKTQSRKFSLQFMAAAIGLSVTCLIEPAFAQFKQELHDMLPERIKQSGVVKVASPRQSRPNIYEEKGVLTGEAPDFMKAIEPILGVTFRFIDVQWPGVIPGIQSGNYDMSIGVTSHTLDRESLFNVIRYRTNDMGVLYKPGSVSPIVSALDLCGLAIGAVQGANVLAILEKQSSDCRAAGKEPVQVRSYPSTGLERIALQSGQIKIYPGTIAELGYLTTIMKEEYGNYNIAVIKDWKAADQAAIVAKGERDLAEAITRAFHVLVENGTYNAILNKWGMGTTAIEKSKIAINPMTGQ